ncbi:MAG: elongation factor P maturation arginine rhamnosyltransferase EarP [Betaproteobacteria bacterium]|nr:elongation factor P maturation arginine rhamnosyltransferase EarP [Betaproteobacteria bacterium]
MLIRIWILCQVVDNFGDAGVTWRLARALAATGNFEPTLVIDQPATLSAIEPRLTAPAIAVGPGTPPIASIDGVHIFARAQIEYTPSDRLPDVIVSAFGCEPPTWLRTRLAGGPRRPLWLQLEYLSAEDWIENCHGLVSIKPADAAREYFLYPGFTERSAGLLREPGLFKRRDAFRATGGPAALLARLHASPAPGQRVMSLFCYESAPLAAWFSELAAGAAPTLVCVAGGSAQGALQTVLGRPLPIGERARVGQVEWVRLPMLDQDDYDRLLWSCTFNAVRGEDSWLRAHWAGVPFVWQAYPQAHDAHLIKLDAFLEKMRQGSPESDPDLQAIRALMYAWNGDPTHDTASAWRAFDARQTASDRLAARYRSWVASLAGQTSLTERLTQYCLDRLE